MWWSDLALCGTTLNCSISAILCESSFSTQPTVAPSCFVYLCSNMLSSCMFGPSDCVSQINNVYQVLSKATEYINHLEKRNKRLLDENAAQKARLAAFETLFRSGSMGINPNPMNNTFQYPPDYVTPGHSPTQEPQGMMPVPDDVRRLQVNMNPQIYQVPQEHYRRPMQQPNEPNGWQNGGYFGKLMVGTLAGLMVMEGFSEAEQQDGSTDSRGLFALPTQLLHSISRGVHNSFNVSLMGYHSPASQTLYHFKSLLVIGALLYVFLPSLFNSNASKSKSGKEHSTTVVAAPSLASPIQVRRQAWLTAIQTVWVPRHNFLLEAAALCLKMLKLSMRNVVGAQGYAYITGITQQQEAARVKAWEIALDAQLAGGDAEINMSRLTLTLLASGTLPDSPARLMLKALHIRVLLWEVGNAGFNGLYMFHEAAAKMARSKWNEARELQKLMLYTKENVGDALPDHLAVLLEQDCDEVLSDAISQRAYNLAWDLPTSRNSITSTTEMNSVVDDFAIRSPLDAVAAWFSSTVLQRALTTTLASSPTSTDAQEPVLKDIELANLTAPIGSGAEMRALVARALIAMEKRGANIAAALQAINHCKQETEENSIHTNTHFDSIPDIKMALRCAMAIAHLDRFAVPSNPSPYVHFTMRSFLPLNVFSLLSFTAVFTLMERVHGHSLVRDSCESQLEVVAGSLRMWIGGKDGEKSGLVTDLRVRLGGRCMDVTRDVIGMVDAGYASMSDEGDKDVVVQGEC